VGGWLVLKTGRESKRDGWESGGGGEVAGSEKRSGYLSVSLARFMFPETVLQILNFGHNFS
jgi:hypothetical protein